MAQAIVNFEAHNVDTARKTLRAALSLVDELDPPTDLRVSAFLAAARLIGQRDVLAVEQQQSPALDLSGLRNGGGLGG